MFNASYRFKVNPKRPNVVTLSPTASTWIKAFLPVILVWGGLWALFAAQERREARELENLDD